MNNPEKSHHGDVLEIATRHLRQSPVAAGPSPQLIARTVAAMRQTPRQKTRWTTMSLMAASLLLAIGAVSWLIYRGSGEIAFADVIRQVAQTKSLQANLTNTDNGFADKSARLSMKGSLGRFDTDDGLVIIEDGAGNRLTLDTKAHLACRSTESIEGNFDPYAECRQMASQTPSSIGKRDFNGRTLDGFSGTITPDGTHHAFATVWVDPKTRLPVRIEVSEKPDGPLMQIIDDLKFDLPLDDSLFDMKVPQGYELRTTLPMRPPRAGPSALSQSRPPVMPTVEIPLPPTPAPAPTTQELQELVLKPGIGIGKLKFGDTKQQVISALGRPQGVMRLQPWELMQYSGSGLIIYVDPKAGLVFIAAGGPSNPSITSRMRPFAGATDKGIRIGSTRAEIEAAYGKDYVEGAASVMDHAEIHETVMIYPRLVLWVTMDSQTKRCVSLHIASPFAPGTSNAVTRPSSQP